MSRCHACSRLLGLDWGTHRGISLGPRDLAFTCRAPGCSLEAPFSISELMCDRVSPAQS